MNSAASEIDNNIPICVDLDGTLLYGDTLLDSFALAMHSWPILIRIPGWILQGKAALKDRLADNIKLNPEILPYNNTLIEFLRDQKELGKRLILVTAAHETIGHAINQYLCLFDDVIGSTEIRNLRGKEKARILIENFGYKQFCYIGNDRTDLQIWNVAESGIVVNATKKVIYKANKATKITKIILKKSSFNRALLKELRLYQWIKNLLVFVPIITANALYDLHAWFYAAVVFSAFCATASGTYVLNDLLDLEADRAHPIKRNRPFASGILSIQTGMVLFPSLFLLGLLLASIANVLLFVLFYALINIAYSIKLKEFPIIDLFILASVYTIRLYAGGVTTGHNVSLWLLAFSCFLFFALAIIKRVADLITSKRLNGGQDHRRGYNIKDIVILQSMGICSSFVSSLVLALYVQSEAAASLYHSPRILWAIVPLILFWQCRLWLSASRGYIKEDPILYAAKDWVSLLIGISLAIILILAKVTS
jgi:4-hydroxybenzoate polyprenyltransferase